MTSKFVVLAAFIMAFSLLTACGGDDTDAGAAETPSSAGETTSTTSASGADGDATNPDDSNAVDGGTLDDAVGVDDALGQVPFETRMGIVTDQLENIDRFEASGSHVDIYYSSFNEMSPPEVDCMIIGMSVLLEGETATLHFPDRDPHTCD